MTFRNTYELRFFVEAIEQLLPFDQPVQSSPSDTLTTSHKPNVNQILTTPVRSEGRDEWTRFTGISAAIGHYVRLAHEGRMERGEAWEAICQYNAAMLQPPWEIKRVLDEAERLWERHCERNGAPKYVHQEYAITFPVFNLEYIMSDYSDVPHDLIGPRLLTPGGMLVIGGAPKVGKSDFIIHLLTHMAAGMPFLGFYPPRPLTVFYLQTELQYPYLKERMHQLRIDQQVMAIARHNVVLTSKTRLILNDEGVERVIKVIKQAFPHQPPDIICIDPIRNVFDGGTHNGGENDTGAMMFFLQERVDYIREKINPDAGVILCHHTRKIDRHSFKDDPFQALSGASSLRGYYTAGILIHSDSDNSIEREIHFELRNGPPIPPRKVNKVAGEWIDVSLFTPEVPQRKQTAETHDIERQRKDDVILQIIRDEAFAGRIYTEKSFAEFFEKNGSLGSVSTIQRRISVLKTNGQIRFIKSNCTDYGLDKIKRCDGYLCVKEMLYIHADGRQFHVLPSHYKHPQTGELLPVESPYFWGCYPSETDDFLMGQFNGSNLTH